MKVSEKLCTREQSEVLQSLGFDRPCEYCWELLHQNGEWTYELSRLQEPSRQSSFINVAITQSQALDWLREIKGLHIDIATKFSEKDNKPVYGVNLSWFDSYNCCASMVSLGEYSRRRDAVFKGINKAINILILKTA